VRSRVCGKFERYCIVNFVFFFFFLVQCDFFIDIGLPC
jgi:hypothetical protein